tara:strand:+ start:113 stop:244 length:132 start_codon:yes stop_codon:yes gene_type:complete
VSPYKRNNLAELIKSFSRALLLSADLHHVYQIEEGAPGDDIVR